MLPAVSRTGARAALERAAPTTKMLSKVAAHLATHPMALTDGDSGAPLPVARLIDACAPRACTGSWTPAAWIAVSRASARPGAGRAGVQRVREAPSPLGAVSALRQALPARRARRRRDDRRLLLRPSRGTLHGLRSQPQRPLVPRICTDCAQRPHTSCETCARDAPIPEPGSRAHARPDRPPPASSAGSRRSRWIGAAVRAARSATGDRQGRADGAGGCA